MIDINSWMNDFLDAVKASFDTRIWFIGLQGSYARNEATDTSDIDLVVILDELTADDIQSYNNILDSLPYRELSCGFISGKRELFNWEPYDLFQLYFDTIPVLGSMDEVLPLVTDEAVSKAIRIGACNIYHGCAHNMIHDHSEKILSGLYKSATFVVQAIIFKVTCCYVSSISDMLNSVDSDEKLILLNYLSLKKGEVVDFNNMSEVLFNWSKKLINHS